MIPAAVRASVERGDPLSIYRAFQIVDPMAYGITDAMREAVADGRAAAVRADERRVMCDEKDATIKRLSRRVQAYREAAWEHLIHTGDDGCTASGYSQDDIPDELLIDAIVDAS